MWKIFAMKKSNVLDQNKIFELYGDYLLSHGEKPKNVYSFAKANDFEESKFYEFFSSFEQIETQMLENLFSRSIELASKIEQYQAMSAKEQLLNVYYIFFENLTLNRSLILMILGNEKPFPIKTFSELKKSHQQFVKTLDFQEWEMMEKASEKVKKVADRSKEELLWLHLISCVEFWKKDTSPSFEKTDLYIEKTIDTGFELIDQEPLKKVLDLGKFLWKEKFKMG